MVSRLTTLICGLLMLVLAACGTPAGETSTGTTASPAAATSSAATQTTATQSATTAPAAGAAGQGPCTPEAASAPAPDPPILVIGTGNTGGVFFPYGGGIARVLTAKLPKAQVTVEETGGSVDNMKLIKAGDADLGLSTVDSAYDALLGQGAYTDTGPIPACTLIVLYQSFVHVVARDGTGISTVEDMKGKTVSVGSAGSSTEGAADRILEAAGLNPKGDITRENLSVADSVAAMKDGKIDAFFWIGGLPTGAVTDLVNTPNVKVAFIPTEQYVKSLTDKYGPVYTSFALPAGTYAGFDQDVPGIGIGNILFANASMNEQLAYDIVKTLFDNLADVQTSHPEAKKLALEAAAVGSSIPLHPGAIKFYQEKGVYKP
ncbi:MAG TPA: TAXI family TRAP transporter solute-binding subunit [Herpetosiphonaceae bacterium]